jgi:hypothetical protein
MLQPLIFSVSFSPTTFKLTVAKLTMLVCAFIIYIFTYPSSYFMVTRSMYKHVRSYHTCPVCCMCSFPDLTHHFGWVLSFHTSPLCTGYGLDDRGVGVRVPVRSRVFCSPHHSDWLWGLANILSDGYQGLFPQGQSSWSVKFITHPQLLPRSRNISMELNISSVPLRYFISLMWALQYLLCLSPALNMLHLLLNII